LQFFLFITRAIMVRAALGFFWVGSLFFFSQALAGATIVKMSGKKQVVLIDAGETEGFSKGKRVCFFDKSQQPLPCGKIIKSEAHQAYVHMNRKNIRTLRKGFTATLQSKERNKETNKETKPARRWGVSVSATPWISTPFRVVVPNYVAPAVGVKTVGSLWAAKETISSSLVSGAVEFYLSSLHLRTGARYLMFPSVAVLQSNYDSKDPKTYVERTFSGSAFGLFRTGGFSLGAGLDVNQSRISVQVQAKNDGKTLDKSIFEITSSLTVVSLYIPVRYEYALFHSPFSLALGGDFLLPLFATGTPQVTEADTVNGSKVADTSSDAGAVLAHKKNSFGLALILGLTYLR
jgi:hypothetical protein